MIPQELFEEIYVSGKYVDPHSELAKRMGVTRDKAKQRAYFNLYETMLVAIKQDIALHEAFLMGASGGKSSMTIISKEMQLVCDSLSVVESESKTIGKKGDRVFQAPKAFWNKSK